MVQLGYAGDRDFQVQGNVFGRFGGRATDRRAGTGHKIRAPGSRGGSDASGYGVVLARVCEALRRDLRRHHRTGRSVQPLDGSEMRLLLDTHIWIWALHSPEKLGRRVRRELQRAGNELYLSPVSIWEAHHLVRRKRLRLQQGFAQWLDDVMARVPLREAPFTFAVAADASRIELPQSDLGDIFLAATALVFDLTLVTSDSQLLACSWLKTLPND